MMALVYYAGGAVALVIVGLLAWRFIGPKLFGDSETVFWGRLQMAAGIAVTALGGIDWTTVIKFGMSWQQMVTVGGGMFLNGLLTEILRKRRTVGGVLGDDLTPIPPKAP